MNEWELLRLLQGVIAGPIRVCRLDDEHARLLGATTTLVWLSRDTVVKQESKHRMVPPGGIGISLDLYQLAPAMIGFGIPRFYEQKPVVQYLLEYKRGEFYTCVVKATKSRAELYLVSIFKVGDERDVRRIMRRTIDWKK